MPNPIEKDQRERNIILIKAELFDLQNEFGQIRVKIEEKIKTLNKLLQERTSSNG